MTDSALQDALGRSVQRTVSIREQVADIIRDAITTQRFRPGQVLVERELCEATGASRTTVREALRQLETEGLITVIPGKGSTVVKLSPEDALMIYEVRAALEGLAGRLFVERADETEILELEKVVNHITENSTSVKEVLAAKDSFYTVLFDGARNPELTRLIAMLHRRITLLRSVSLAAPDRIKQSITELREIVDAAKRRDADAVNDLCVAHIRAAAEAALSGLATETES